MIPRASLLLATLLLVAGGTAGCKRGVGKAGANGKDKATQVEAVPVEIAPVAHRTMVASYTGTAALEARGVKVEGRIRISDY